MAATAALLRHTAAADRGLYPPWESLPTQVTPRDKQRTKQKKISQDALPTATVGCAGSDRPLPRIRGYRARKHTTTRRFELHSSYATTGIRWPASRLAVQRSTGLLADTDTLTR